MSEMSASMKEQAATLAPVERRSESRDTRSDQDVPRHVAIIMDGNYRWAKSRHLPGAAGHRAGARRVRPIAESCADLGVKCLTLFAFSTENWGRPRREVSLLMDLMRNVLRNDVEGLNEREVRLRIIGDRSRFDLDLQRSMEKAESLTSQNTKMQLNIAANFGGRWDITEAARALARDVRDGHVDVDAMDESTFARYLSLGDLPAPDLCIRTGGDRRISNFLLWDLAYSELYFTDAFWPDFDQALLADAFSMFVERQRRFGRRG